MKTCTATALTLSRRASSTSTAMRSSERSLRMEGPPEARRTTALGDSGLMSVRRTPRVHMSASAKGASGLMVTSMRSRPVVGPWK